MDRLRDRLIDNAYTHTLKALGPLCAQITESYNLHPAVLQLGCTSCRSSQSLLPAPADISFVLHDLPVITCTSHLLTQIANQPIRAQPSDTFRHVDEARTTCWNAKRSIGMREVTLNVVNAIISRVYSDGPMKGKISAELQLMWRKILCWRQRSERLEIVERQLSVKHTLVTIYTQPDHPWSSFYESSISRHFVI